MVNLARPNPALRERTGHAAMSLMFAYALQQGRYSSDPVTGFTDRLLEIAETLNNSVLAAQRQRNGGYDEFVDKAHERSGDKKDELLLLKGSDQPHQQSVPEAVGTHDAASW